MPIGTRHVLTGILRTTLLGHVLEVADGVWWQLDIAASTEAHIGRRVIAEGVCTGIQRLAVEQLTLDEEDPPVEATASIKEPVTAVVEGIRWMRRWWR